MNAGGPETVADLKVHIMVGGGGARNRRDARRQCGGDSPREIRTFRRCSLIYNVSDMKPFPFGSILGEFEQLVLLALLRLGNGAYGAAIHKEIVTRTGREVPVSAVYVTLERLERKRMVCSYIGTATPQRGGRRRKHYLLDTAGQRALVRAYRTFGAMIAGLQAELDELAIRMWPGAAGATPTARRVGW